MRMPTFSRQSRADSEDEQTTDVLPARRDREDTTVTDRQPVAVRPAPPVVTPPPPSPRRPMTDGGVPERKVAVPERKVDVVPVRDDRKPRASLLATVGLIFSVMSALLVLSGPLLGYGIGLAVLALILSLGGISATGKRHIAGKTDALIGMILSLGAIVIGVLALTGSLSWLGTDMHPVTSLRGWLDTQFAHRF